MSIFKPYNGDNGIYRAVVRGLIDFNVAWKHIETTEKTWLTAREYLAPDAYYYMDPDIIGRAAQEYLSAIHALEKLIE